MTQAPLLRFEAPRERLAYALDVPTLEEARRQLELLAPVLGVFKVGLELFLREGPAVLRAVRETGARCFLDLKLHDIPNTVRGAVRSVLAHEVDLLTVHCSGGPAMLRAAAEAAASAARPPVLLGVTVLTSLADADLSLLGVEGGASTVVPRWGQLALDAGLGGLVCSPHEVAALRALSPSAVLVTPGIRAGNSGDDQQRTATVTEAIRAGATLLVVGRPIRDAASPRDAARLLLDELGEATR